jgi:hypothetical protein
MGNTESYSKKNLINSCKKDNINYIKKYSYKLNDNDINKYFNTACCYGAKNIVYTMSQIENILIYDKTLNMIMGNEYFDIFIILINEKIIHLDDNILQKACQYNLDFVKCILIIGNNIDIHNPYNLFNALLNEKINIIKFLINKNIDYEFSNDFIFKEVCKIGNKEIIDFFIDICPRYEYVEYNNFYQPMIKDKIIYFIENKLWIDLIDEVDMKIEDNFRPSECCITLDDSDMITNCNHHFKFIDLMAWYLKKNICPICSRKIILKKCIIDKKIFQSYNQN